MLALSLLALTLLAAPLPAPSPQAAPPQVYQPLLLDPHIRAGGLTQPNASNNTFQNGFLNGDLTPDGRLMLAYRRVDLDALPGSGPMPSRQAFTAALVKPERFQLQNGHITSFVDANGNYVFGNAATIDGDPSNDEFAIIHHGYEFIETDSSDPDRIDMSSSPFDYFDNIDFVKLDPDYPIGGRWAGSHVTMCLIPNPHTGPFQGTGTLGSGVFQAVPIGATGNPYPSSGMGVYKADGNYTTYKLWVVRLTSEGWVTHIEANTGGGAYFRPKLNGSGGPLYPTGSELVSQVVTVIIDETTQTIHKTDVEPFKRIMTIDNDPVEGIEVSITADGKFILFHGRVDDPLNFSPGHADVAYIYNQTACASTNWTPVRSITEPPPLSELTPEFTDIEAFKERYKVFKHPIRMGASDGSIADHSPGDPGNNIDADHVRGAYTWISKDGSFFHATCGPAIDNAVPGEQTQGPGCRVGNYICGDITGGYIKYIDETGIVPTRNGEVWDWPDYRGAKDSQRNLVMSLGLKPGLWEGFLGTGAPMPTTQASQRIPILPLIMNTNDTYGEVRFEEADGNYLLYLACNEALVRDSTATTPIGTDCHIFSTDYTPDTSGRTERAPVTLNDGAGFAPEVYGSSLAVRQATAGVFLGNNTLRFHENLGFKGQAIITNLTGRIEAIQTDPLDPRVERFLGNDAFTAQLFFKSPAEAPSGTFSVPLIEHGVAGYPAFFELRLHEDGSLSTGLWCYFAGTTPIYVPLQTGPGLVDFGSNLDDCRDGWSHIAVTYSGAGGSELRIWVNGEEEAALTNPLSSTVLTPQDVNVPDGPAYYAVGPGAPGVGTVVTLNDATFVFDEVAISDVARTEAELRRDAYVAPLPSEFTTLPTGVALPAHLADEAHWPIGVPHSTAIVDLGRNLFNSPDLSVPTSTSSCATCHEQALGFTDGNEFAPSALGGNLDFNSPTLLGNLFAGHKTFSGKASTIEAQIPLPLTDPAEMGAQTLTQITNRLGQDANWLTEFNNAFSALPSPDNLVDALSAYVLTLNSVGSPFDNEQTAPGTLSINAQKGRSLFNGKARCIGCHRGESFTDGDFHNIRTVTTMLSDRGSFTGRAREDGAVKTPSLRNLSLTGPYFHNGSKDTLTEVIEHYNDGFLSAGTAIGTPDRFLRPLGLSSVEISRIVAFLESLDGSNPN